MFIDALMSHMPEPRGSENTRSPVFVRDALDPLATLCKNRKVTGLFGLHPRKAGGDTFAESSRRVARSPRFRESGSCSASTPTTWSCRRISSGA